MSDWAHPFNVYTSRKDGDGMIYKLSSPMWMVLLLYLLGLLNAVLWGGIGIYQAITVIV